MFTIEVKLERERVVVVEIVKYEMVGISGKLQLLISLAL